MNMARSLRAAALPVLGALLLPAVAQAQAEGAVNLRLQRVEQALENKGLLDLVRQVELLQQEVRQLRGELENQIFALEQQRKSQRDAYVDVDRRLGALEQGGAPVSAAGAIAALPAAPDQLTVDPPLPTLTAAGDSRIAGAPAEQSIAVDVTPQGVVPDARIREIPRTAATAPPVPGAAVPPAAPAAVPPTPAAAVPPAHTAVVINTPTPPRAVAGPTIDSAASETAYREAFTMLKAGQYEDSIAAFNSYLQLYPASRNADNAQYWLGEAYYVMRQFEPAIEQYQKLLQNHPASKKQSHAMLKIAYSYDELGLSEQAAAVLTDLKTRFPGSAAARLADERMQRMRAVP